MSDPEDPPRLLDSLDEAPGLREALRRARADVGTDAEVARLEARLGPILSSPGAPPPAPGLATKLGLGGLALMAAAGSVWLLSSRSVPPPPVTAPRAPSVAPASSASATSVESLPEPPMRAAPPEPSTTATLAPPRVVAPRGPTEAELLEQARAALKSGDSARALQRATEHARRYPRGVLVQEREVLAIQALRRLGRDAEADRRVEAFSKAYPGSAFQRRLER